MTDEETRFRDYVANLNARTLECQDESEEDSGDDVIPGQFTENAFTHVVIDTLEDLGQVPGGEVCYFDRMIKRAYVKVNAWFVDEEENRVDLFTTVHRGDDGHGSISRSDLSQAIHRAGRILSAARDGYHEGMEPASGAYDMMQRLNEVAGCTDRVRIMVLAHGVAQQLDPPELGLDGIEVDVDIWDLRRLYRAESSGLPYESIEIDLVSRLGTPLVCLPMPDGGADYSAFLAVVPGELLHDLYHEFGARLLELNVRSFLQARGKVNKGIRATLRTEPARFLAYNNGISVTAEDVQLVDVPGSGKGISRITGLQIVNGGQTVASIHRAGQQNEADLSQVHVQAKLTIVNREHIETLVPLVSRYANTQNKVNEADFSANHPFHVRMQQLSETVWCPGEQSRWFYERARGQYQVAKSREATSAARRRAFEIRTPAKQKFDKVLLAKYLNSWEQLPHVVSMGGQKNFVRFMDHLGKTRGHDWEPDRGYYRDLIAKAIVFKRAEKAARKHAFPAYRANAITYTVALVSYRTAGRVDLGRVWEDQCVSDALATTMEDWMEPVWTEIGESAGGRNVTEWCKKEECWRGIQTIDVSIPPALESELAEGQPLPTVGRKSGRTGRSLSPQDRENIAQVMQVSAEEWFHLSKWGTQSGGLEVWQAGIAGTLAAYAACGWNNVPSQKQASQGMKILRQAEELGGRLVPVDD